MVKNVTEVISEGDPERRPDLFKQPHHLKIALATKQKDLDEKVREVCALTRDVVREICIDKRLHVRLEATLFSLRTKATTTAVKGGHGGFSINMNDHLRKCKSQRLKSSTLLACNKKMKPMS
mmetsp:Transcript_13341/g.20841  ORF Transcript_13341/g.20841 Transcript_13341/m.20841 type:complete len:122 (+) Transcript_13341:8015-8380(+)